MRPLAWGLAALVLTACDPAPAPAVPDGQVLDLTALDGEHALVTVEQDRDGTLALLDGTGAALWTTPWTGGDLEKAMYRGSELTGEHLVLLGEHITVYARADGRLVARRPLAPVSLAQRMGDPGSAEYRLADGIVLSQAGDARRTWITAFDPVAGRDLWQIGRPGHTDIVAVDDGALILKIAIEAPEPDFGIGVASIHEIVDLHSGAPRGRVLGRDHCVAGGALFGFDGRRLGFADLARPHPRVVELRPAYHEREWLLEGCHRAGARAWLELRANDQILVVDVNLEQGRQTGQHGLCDGSFEPPLDGPWLVIRPPAAPRAVVVHDVVRGRLAWRQDLSVDNTPYSSQFSADGVLYLRGLIRDISTNLAIWRLVALDAASGEILGAAALVDAEEFDAADVRGGQLWLFRREVTRGGAVPLVRLDARTLQPRGPLPRGLDVIDTTAQARAARLTAGDDEPGATWDPAGGVEPDQRCRPSFPPTASPSLPGHARERAR